MKKVCLKGNRTWLSNPNHGFEFYLQFVLFNILLAGIQKIRIIPIPAGGFQEHNVTKYKADQMTGHNL